jgi:hypothetical protein
MTEFHNKKKQQILNSQQDIARFDNSAVCILAGFSIAANLATDLNVISDTKGQQFTVP